MGTEQEERTTIPDGFGFSDNNNNEPEQDSFDIDKLADETDEKFKIPGDEDAFGGDLGWGGEEEGAGEGEGSGEREGPGEEEGAEGTEAGEGAGEGEGEGNEPEDFYDAKRDFPDEDVTPTVYKDRVKLNSGVADKINYARNLKQKLEELGSSIGALRLPEIFGEDEGFVDRPFDRSQFADQDDDTAKKTVVELDRFIRDMNTKLENVKQAKEQEEQVTQVSEEYKQAVTQLVKDLELMGISPKKAQDMTVAAINDKIDAIIADYEGDKGDEYVAEHGASAYYKYMRSLEDARSRIQEFPNIAAKQKQVQEKTTKSSNEVDVKKVEAAWEETRKDRPDHPVFATKETERAFLEWMENEIYHNRKTPPETPRSWVKVADEYQAVVEAEYKKYQQKTTNGVQPNNSDNRADRSKKNKPEVTEIATDKSSKAENPLVNVREVDNELDKLARELDSKARG